MHFGNLFGIGTENEQGSDAVPLRVIHSFSSVGICVGVVSGG